MAPPCAKLPALYRPRDPHASDLWRLIDEHFDSFQQFYDERFQAKYGFWRLVIERSVEAFLKCGDLQEGFARVRCTDCKQRPCKHGARFVAYSCKQPTGTETCFGRLRDGARLSILSPEAGHRRAALVAC